MKTATVICALTAIANAHYTFPSLIANDETTAAWQYARQWTGYQSNGPVTDVSKIDIRCNVGASAKSAPSTMTVAAGSKIGFGSNQPISHVGVMEWYMAKVPAGHTAATWDGSGEVWFKIDEDHPTFAPLKWPSLSEFGLFRERKRSIDLTWIRHYKTIHHHSNFHTGRRVSAPSRTHCTALCWINQWSSILYFVWPVERYWRWSRRANPVGGFPRSIQGVGSWNFD